MIREIHTPYKLIYRNEIFNIIDIHRKFIVKEFIVKTVDGNIDSVFLNNPHPNANPRTGEFCIPNKLRKLTFDKTTISLIRSMITCFNLDDCYFTPWDEIQYERV